mgnify:CR=1 FL=1
MKIIHSRKGFDSGYGGCASPIFPDKSMASFPIPDACEELHTMKNVRCGKYNCNLGEVAENLTRGLKPAHPIGDKQMIHLDPDLRDSRSMGKAGWLQAFGQDGSAQSHLSKQRVGENDLFLFFGWFRCVELVEKRWHFVPDAPDIHVLFGWLQVGTPLKVAEYQNRSAEYQWLAEHPHIRHADRYPKNNTIYIAAPQLSINKNLPGGGTFSHFDDALRLTHPDSHLRSVWQLPSWFSQMDANDRHALTYHGRASRWCHDEKFPSHVRLQSVAKGQEFVLNIDSNNSSDASRWLRKLFKTQSNRG